MGAERRRGKKQENPYVPRRINVNADALGGNVIRTSVLDVMLGETG